jgi:hypothetical protein
MGDFWEKGVGNRSMMRYDSLSTDESFRHEQLFRNHGPSDASFHSEAELQKSCSERQLSVFRKD